MAKLIEIFDGIEIHGSVGFIAEMKEALTLLQLSPSFNEVRTYIDIIDQSEFGAATPATAPSQYDGKKPSYNHSAVCFAGDIARLAYLSKLRRDQTVDSDASERSKSFQSKVERELYAFSLDDYRFGFVHW